MAYQVFGLVLLFLGINASAISADDKFSSNYILGPQDKLEIRVHDLRAGTGEAHKWAAFDGEFVVNSVGTVSLPIIGDTRAGGGTVTDLSQAIASRFQSKVGLAQLPSASVQVIRYRPFYVNGAIDKPGEYEFRPGLTVIQAVSIAGGLMRQSDGAMAGFQRDSLVQRGDLRALKSERQGLLVRQARVSAETAESDVVIYPSEITKEQADPSVVRAIKEETSLFEARRNALKAQTNAMTNAKILLNGELKSLDEKDESLLRQIGLIRKELDSVTNLVVKGLAVAPRQYSLEQSIAAYENNRIDVQVGRLRVRQDLSKIDRESIELKARYRNEALVEAREVRDRLAANSEKLETASNLIYQAEVLSPMSISNAGIEIVPVYTITRFTQERFVTRTAPENEHVEPGDVLRVSVPRQPPVLRSDSGRASN